MPLYERSASRRPILPTAQPTAATRPVRANLRARTRAGVRLLAVYHGGTDHSGAIDARQAPPGSYDSAMASHPDPGQPRRPPRVLLVDDTPAIRAALRGLLQDAGMVVVGEAADGLEGIEQAAALRPDVVLIDWRMPRLSGVQATLRIRQQFPQIQVVMFSHIEGEQAEAAARAAGACAFVPKGAATELVCAAVWAAWRRPQPNRTTH
jgi:CheY-like chemotaxis protein